MLSNVLNIPILIKIPDFLLLIIGDTVFCRILKLPG